MNTIAPAMTRGLLLIAVVVWFGGCKPKNEVSTDPAQNRYFSAYDTLYKQWGKIPTDSLRPKLDTYLAEFPENSEARLLAGYLAYSQADYQTAVFQYRKATEYQPNNSLYFSALGSSYNALNQSDSALAALQKALSLHDTTGGILLNISKAYLRKHEPEKSRQFVAMALQRDSSSPIVASGASYIFSGLGEAGKSQLYFERATKLGLKDTAGFARVLAGTLKLEDYYRTNY